jgi:hypothetical protein
VKLDFMPKGFPFHAKNPDTNQNVYHDHTECEAAKKIRLVNRLPGSGGLEYCENCRSLSEKGKPKNEPESKILNGGNLFGNKFH